MPLKAYKSMMVWKTLHQIIIYRPDLLGFPFMHLTITYKNKMLHNKTKSVQVHDFSDKQMSLF